MKRYIKAVMEELLTARQRAIIKMKYGGLSVQEIADIAFMTERAVRKNIKAAMAILTVQKNIFLKGN